MLLGITGGMATGKSAVADLLRERGAVVLSADEAAREVVEPESAVLTRIVERFGPNIRREDGTLDRAKLAAQIFSDPQARRDLEAITHPPILHLLKKKVEAARAANSADTIIAAEIPLLFETGMESWFERILVVAASPDVQVDRLVRRTGLPKEEAERRIASQMPLKAKIARADTVVWNDRTREDLAAEIDRLIKVWLKEGQWPSGVQST